MYGSGGDMWKWLRGKIWNCATRAKPTAAEGVKFWNFARVEGAADGEPDAELLLYGDISDVSWWEDDITPKTFADDLAGLGDVNHIRVRINSYGGDVFAANAIHNMLRGHSAKITAHIDGIAASAASVVAMAGDEVVMPGNAMMMVHNPWTVVAGDARDMRKMAGTLDQVRETILVAYEAKTGMERPALINLLNSETWMTADEALGYGFADTVIEPLKIAASAKPGVYMIGGREMDLSKLKTWPGALLASAEAEAEVTSEESPVISEPEAEESQEAERTEAAEGAVAEGEEGTEAEEAQTEEETTETEAADPVAAERDRIQAIERLAEGIVGCEELVFLAKYGRAAADGKPAVSPMSAEEFAVALLESGKVRNAQALAARRKAAGLADVPASSPGVGGGDEHAMRVAAEMNRQRGVSPKAS